MYAVRETLRSTKKDYAKTEDDLKSLQSVGQIIGEVLRPLDNERCNSTFQYSYFFYLMSLINHSYIILFAPDTNFELIYFIYNIAVIVKASSGPRYVVGCRSKVDKEKLTAGTRVVLDMTTLTIMRALPREVSLCVIYTSKVSNYLISGCTLLFYN